MPTLLIVDDSKTARMMLKHWITSMLPSATILEAGGSDEAESLLKSSSPSDFYMIIDHNMPGMTGLDFVETAKNYISVTHIALCTANIQTSIRERARAAGIVYVPKPVTPAKVETLLKELKV